MEARINEKRKRIASAEVIRHLEVLSVVVVIVFALLPGHSPGAEQVPSQKTSLPEAPAIPEDVFGRGSPRGSVKGYFAACREGDYQKAANYPVASTGKRRSTSCMD
jgi:MscS family membrane protein